ncbi:MAG TPA: PAS domain S-box protein [Gemmatimonadales bacterium]|jgi:PAS domain S-box-containing protein
MKTSSPSVSTEPAAASVLAQDLATIEALHGSNVFRQIVEQMPAGIYTCDADGLITYFNQRAVDAWGRAPKLNDPIDRFCGSFRLYVDGVRITHNDCWMTRALKEDRGFNGEEVVIERPDGTRMTVLAHANPIRDANGRVTGAMNVVVDITDRKRAEDALRESDRQARQEFEHLLDNLPAGAYTCDAQGLITYFNEQAVAVWGRSPKLNDQIDKFCGSFKLFVDGKPIKHEQCWMARALKENRGFNGEEIVVERPNGTQLTVMAHANPIHDETGRVTGAVNVLVDITERKRAEETLKKGEARKDLFLSKLAHELRNQLGPTRSVLHVLREVHTGATYDQARSMLQRQIEQMVQLVDHLTDVAQLTQNRLTLRKERIELGGVVRGMVKALQQGNAAGHKVIVSAPSTPIQVYADPARLTQALKELIANAVRNTPNGGQISIGAERSGSHAVISVKDNGNGIHPDDLPQIFDMMANMSRSVERGQGGLGIGLTLVRGIVELHGGILEARSDGLGRGSEFFIRLPIAS